MLRNSPNSDGRLGASVPQDHWVEGHSNAVGVGTLAASSRLRRLYDRLWECGDWQWVQRMAVGAGDAAGYDLWCWARGGMFCELPTGEM